MEGDALKPATEKIVVKDFRKERNKKVKKNKRFNRGGKKKVWKK